MTDDRLTSCPFCASSEVNMDKDQESAGKRYNPRCNGCGASGGWFSYEKDAIETWNNASELVERDREA